MRHLKLQFDLALIHLLDIFCRESWSTTSKTSSSQLWIKESTNSTQQAPLNSKTIGSVQLIKDSPKSHHWLEPLTLISSSQLHKGSEALNFFQIIAKLPSSGNEASLEWTFAEEHKESYQGCRVELLKFMPTIVDPSYRMILSAIYSCFLAAIFHI